MSEPTKEAIEEATPLLLEHAVECFDGMVMSVVGLAHIIAHVRKKARDDVLDGAKSALDDERVDGTVSPEDAAYNAAIDHCIEALDAMKDKPDGEA